MRITGMIFEEERTVMVGTKTLDPKPSQKLRNHSPDGFSWGYGGSGPAQLALAIMLELFEEEVALAKYQDFKWTFIASLEIDKGFSISIQEVKDWMATQK